MSLLAGSWPLTVEGRDWLYNSKHQCLAFWDFHLKKGFVWKGWRQIRVVHAERRAKLSRHSLHQSYQTSGRFALISCDFQSSQSSCHAGVGNGTATAAPGSVCADKPCSDQGWVAQRGTVRLWWSDQISAGSEPLLQLPWHCCHPACLQQSLFLRPLLCECDGDKSCTGVIFQFTGSCVKVCVCEVDGAFEFEWEHWKRGFRAFKLEGHAEMSSCSKEVWKCQNKLCWILKFL